MSVELLKTISLGFFIASGVLLLVGIILFFVLDIPAIYGDISGRTAKKAIEEIRKRNEESGTKAYKPSEVNIKRGKITDKISASGKLLKRNETSPVNVGTQKIGTQELPADSAETSVLGAETSVLGAETSVLGAETSVLTSQGGASETTVLGAPVEEAKSVCFTLITEKSFTAGEETV